MDGIGLLTFQFVILAVMLVGLFGLLTVIIPGLVIIWVAALVYGLVTGFTWTTGIIFMVITLLMAAGSIVDNLLMGANARQTGASWLSIGVSLVAGFVGSLVWPPFGGLLVALVALFAVEYFRLKDVQQAWASTRSMAVGCGWAVVLRLAAGALMIGLWMIWAWAL
ncbi:MAG: DUF456 domain-containing protein [Chloroflexi bacterium]|jgi:uncharacterized protein YqgC (DUF456 family)|nr:DUF456 domain-containing protein [Anaerolineaceae bacterium]NMB89823.1 DUF456 domain-containing protein [Chloroflexota bacterium]